jgi:hypothetical protein
MLTLFLFSIVILGVLIAFARSRQSNLEKHWSDLTARERLLLSIALAGVFQFLFLLPGWIIAACIVGYSDGVGETQLENVVFGMITLIANTVIYFPLFYLLLGWLSSRFRNKQFFESKV